MKSCFTIILLTSFLLGAGVSSAQGQTETVVGSWLNFDEWAVGNEHEEKGKYYIIEFVRQGETVKDWTELLTMQNFTKSRSSLPLTEYFQSQKDERERVCPGTTTWNLIAKDDNSILYEWRAKPCLGFPDQHEISRVLDGKLNRFRIAFTKKVKEITKVEREKWVKDLLTAQVIYMQ